jgi:hypothetical protein
MLDLKSGGRTMVMSRGWMETALVMIGWLALAAGCATAPMTSSAQNTEAKTFQVAQGTANVYLARRSNGFGDTLEAYTHVDGQNVGALAPNTFQLVSVTPGHHTLSVAGPTNSEQVDLEAVAGNNYFYDVSIVWAGPMIRHRHIKAMSDADGQAEVNSLNRAVTTTANPS